MDSPLIQEIKDLHLNPKAIVDAGGVIDGQLLEEHRKLLVRKARELAEKLRIEIRQDRQVKIKRAKKDIKSEDDLKQELKNIDRWVEIGENTVKVLEDSKVKELENEQA